ncbi:MAG: efflux RND transporter periplasmic adaptor subunit [Proteobacteria bacterium]|nr:efflux RND transporter periplasmic adaptor subunit [Pseudomonadota bacterium]
MPDHKKKIHIILAVLILILGVIGMKILGAQKKQIEKKPPRSSMPSVEFFTVKLEDHQIVLTGEGTVKPLKEISIVPQVSGKVIDISPSFINGGRFEKEDILFRIDPVDYELAVTMARASMKTAESNLKLAEEAAVTAQEEWMLHDKNVSANRLPPSDLVLKKPQLLAAQARLAAETANLERAMLNLDRTIIKAPFPGRVGNKQIDIGQFINTGVPVASIFSTESVEIAVPLEDDKLFWFYVPGFSKEQTENTTVSVKADFSGHHMIWQGEIHRASAKVDERTRMIDVIVRVAQPYKTTPPLAPGLFVSVDIYGKTIENAAGIPPKALHENNVVWVLDDDNKITFRPVEIAMVQKDLVIVKKGLENGQRIVTTRLKSLTNGMNVKPLPYKTEEDK